MMQISMKILATLFGLTVLAGCAGQSATEADFGNSVRGIVAAQTLGEGGPLAADEPLRETDGRRVATVLESTHRSSVGDPTTVVRDKVINTQSK